MKKFIISTTFLMLIFSATASHAEFTKVCIKDGIGGLKAITVPSLSFCPLGWTSVR